VRKGVARETIDEAVGNVTPDDELGMATSLLAKKARSLPDDPEARRAETQRHAAYLQRRGFGWGIIKEALKSLGEQADEPPDD
jgi:SOS response regulatory protein OraA/RecX